MTRETPKAAQAFSMFVALGPKRSLPKLAAEMVHQNFYKSSSVAHRMVAEWSRIHHWRDRIAEAVTAHSTTLIAQATEIDNASYLRTSEIIAERLAQMTPLHLDTVLKTRESVRPKGKNESGGNTTVLILNYIREEAERRGLDPVEAVRVANEIVAGAQR